MAAQATAIGVAGASYVAAAALAAVTIFVFYTLRDYGPESAVRRFHDDLRTRNFVDLQKVVVQPVNNESVQTLGRFIYDIDQVGGVSKIVGMDRSPGQVDLLSMYQLPDRTQPLVWVVVHRKDLNWQVDADQTVRASTAITRGFGEN